MAIKRKTKIHKSWRDENITILEKLWKSAFLLMFGKSILLLGKSKVVHSYNIMGPLF